jgi:hypothetical protein
MAVDALVNPPMYYAYGRAFGNGGNRLRVSFFSP